MFCQPKKETQFSVKKIGQNYRKASTEENSFKKKRIHYGNKFKIIIQRNECQIIELQQDITLLLLDLLK